MVNIGSRGLLRILFCGKMDSCDTTAVAVAVIAAVAIIAAIAIIQTTLR
jgi:hypothetical protein